MTTHLQEQLERVQLDQDFEVPNIPVNEEFPKIDDPYLRQMIDDVTRRFSPTCHNRIHFGIQPGMDFKSCVPLRTDETMELFTVETIIMQWLREKHWQLSISETVPILQEPPQSSAESLMDKLKQAYDSLHGLGRIMIKIRAGHVFSLFMVGDTVVVEDWERNFAQLFPLFIDVSVKAEPAVSDTCQVIVAIEIAPMKAANNNIGGDDNVPSSPSSLPDDHDVTAPSGPICCLYEEMATVAGVCVTSAQYFYHGGYAGGISETS